MSFAFLTFLAATALGVAMLAMLECGRQLGLKRVKADPEGAHLGTGTIEGALFALLGLLLAFSFSGAALRFDSRRQLVVEEANAIGTAYLRVDLLPVERQHGLRELFRQYVDARLAMYEDPSWSREEYSAARQRALALQDEIWKLALQGGKASETQAAMILLVPAINQMFDLANTRHMAIQMHPPWVIYGLMFLIGLACALVAGYGMAGGRQRSWLHAIGLAVVLSLTFYVILELEFPRLGLVRVDSFDSALFETRAAMR